MKKPFFSLLTNEKGAVLVIFAFAVVFLLGISALAVDVGAQGVEKRKMVTAADAAALAGGQFLPDNPARALAVAKEYASYYGYELSDSDITFENNNRKIIVRIPGREVGYFSRFFGAPRQIEASAAAEKQLQGLWQLNPGIITFKDNGELEIKGNVTLGTSSGCGSILIHSNGKMEVKENVVKAGEIDVYGTAKNSIEDKTGGLFSSKGTGVVHQPPFTAAQLEAFKARAIASGQYFKQNVLISSGQVRHWTGVVYIDRTCGGFSNKLELNGGRITGGALIIVDGKVELKGNADLHGALYVLGGSNGIELKENCNVTVNGALMSLEKIEFKDSSRVTVNYDDSFVSVTGSATLKLVQ